MALEQKHWVTLTDAAQQLGVHPTTLRRWADNGSIPVYITPGGHRRFLQADIDAFVGSHELHALQNPDTMRYELEKYTLNETRQRLAKGTRPPALDVFNDEQREHQRELGKRMLGLLVQHVSASDEDDELFKEADNIAHLYAESCITSALSIPQALEIILFFRDHIAEIALQMPQVVQSDEEAHMRLLRKINQVFNRIQLSLVAYYQEKN